MDNIQDEDDNSSEVDSSSEDENLFGNFGSLFGGDNEEDERQDREINKKLEALNMEIFEIPSDGHCLFRAISHQLKERYSIDKDVKELRKIAAEMIRRVVKEKGYHNEVAAQLDEYSNETYTEYCNRVENGDYWGGQAEINAISKNEDLRLKVFVHNFGLYDDGKPLCLGCEDNLKIIHLSFHRYKGAEHYNSVVAKKEPEASGETKKEQEEKEEEQDEGDTK